MKKITIIIFCILLLNIFTFGCNKILTRQLTKEDYTINTEIGIGKFYIYITPKVDIEEINITLIFLDSNNKIINEKTETTGNIEAYKKITVTFNIDIGSLLKQKFFKCK